MAEMAEDDLQNYTRYTFGDTEFIVPSRYIELSARGTGAQGMVWWVFVGDEMSLLDWLTNVTPIISMPRGSSQRTNTKNN